jgi:hypothetical protein
MSSFYLKGRGRKTAQEKSLISDIEKIISENDLKASDLDQASSVEELEALRDNLQNEFPGSASEGTSRSFKAPDNMDGEEPAPKEPSNDVDPEPAPKETENFDSPEMSDGVFEDNYKLSDFEELNTSHPFTAEFKEEDMFKASEFSERFNEHGGSGESDPGAVENSVNDPGTDAPSPELSAQESAPQPWEVPSEPTPQSSSPVEITGPENPEDEKKVKLARSTSKKATKSFAKQMTNLTCMGMEGGAKWFGKVKESDLKKLEKQGKIDRDWIFDQQSGKSVKQWIDQNNEFLDEVINIDEDTRDELEEAILLVAEKHDIQVSPESNLMFILLNIAFTIGKASWDHRKMMKRTLDRISDNYTLNAKMYNEQQVELEQLREYKRNSQRNKTNGSETPEQETPIKELSFDKAGSDKPSLSVKKEDPQVERKVEGATAILEEVTSTIEGDDMARPKVVKPGKKTTKKK